MTSPAFLLRRLLRAPVVALLLLSGLSVSAATVKFDIPAQPAAAALQLFIRQSGCEVLFPFDELKDVRTNAVQGDFEPATALAKLMEGTGYAATPQGAKKFLLSKAIPAKSATGSVKGSLRGEGGKRLPDVLVAIRETGQSTSTDQDGVYSFPNVVPGTYMIVATATGYQPLHITDVEVRSNRDLTLSREDMRRALGDVTALEPFVVHADAVTELEKYLVEGQREKPFTGANVDIPRTVDDVQAYYIFDAKTIDQSGATNVEDFLKKRLTMNATALTNSQASMSPSAGITNYGGNTSTINLRGLGANSTLILVNGRRMAGVTFSQGPANGALTDGQPDLNGIPLNAIDRIEVLPSSASGIYGGSALGGVVNVILKKNYTGGEVRLTYDNTWNTDSPIRTISANYGMALEGGRTHLSLNASWSDAQPLLLQDRRGIYERNLNTILRNSPSVIYSGSGPTLGATANIQNSYYVLSPVPAGTPDSYGPYPPGTILIPGNSPTTVASPYLIDVGFANLVLKSGATLSSINTYIPPGTSPSTPTATLYSGLAANAGSWNLNLPLSTQQPTGLLRPFGATPETKSFQASMSRQMLPTLEMFSDFSYSSNRSESVVSPNPGLLQNIPTSSPVNPFTTTVNVMVPDGSHVPFTTDSESRSFTAGAIIHLPWDWTGEFDYSWSENRFGYLYYNSDTAAINVDVASGALNPFVDTLLYPLDMTKYWVPFSYAGSSTLNDFALRGSGPLFTLPWGKPNLTLGLEHRLARNPANTFHQVYPLTPANNGSFLYYSRHQTTDSAYAETLVPLIKKDWLPLIHALELQLSGRSERYTVDAGTVVAITRAGRTTYSGPTLNGQPYFSKATYTSTNGTVGLKYQPAPELTFRASVGTAFLPPAPTQLIQNPLQSPTTTPVNDPKTGHNGVPVYTLSGGNPDLKPQNSKSTNVGAIWEPHWRVLKGLRLNVEYYRIEQDDAIATLSAQQIVNMESTFPGRVTRDSSGTITLVDASAVNVYKKDTQGWDLSADYTLKTAVGTFNLIAAESIIEHLKQQVSLTLPNLDYVNFPAEGGAAKYKSSATLTWEWRGWTAGWTVTRFGSYKQYGAAGGPYSIQNNQGAAYTYYIQSQGGDTIPSQVYHDLFLSHAFGKQNVQSDSKLKSVGATLLDGLALQFGVRNVFNKVPPFDPYYATNYYESPYGDLRLRSYWITVRKDF